MPIFNGDIGIGPVVDEYSVQSSRVADEPAFLSYQASPNEGGIPGGNSVFLVGPKTRLGRVPPGLGLTLR